MNDKNNAMLLWQLISPTLPIGAYAWSGGMEYAVEAGWIKNEAEAANWIQGQIRQGFSNLEVPMFCRLYDAWQAQDLTAVNNWNCQLLAMRESAELQQQDMALAAALLKVLPMLNVAEPARRSKKCFSCVFAYATQQLGIEKVAAAQGLVWSWCENQVVAAIKLVPLGQSSGQRILSGSMPIIAAAVERGQHCEDQDIGMLMPGVAIASALHETQYSRLFRS